MAMRHHLFLEFWLVYTWDFAEPRLESVHQSNIWRGKKLGFQLQEKHSVKVGYHPAKFGGQRNCDGGLTIPCDQKVMWLYG